MAKKDTKSKLPENVAELEKMLLMMKTSLREGTLSNPHAISAVKRQIARVKTKENEAKKGTK